MLIKGPENAMWFAWQYSPTYLGDSVGLLSVGDLSRARAVGGVLVNDLGGVGDRGIVPCGCASDERGSEGHGVLHIE